MINLGITMETSLAAQTWNLYSAISVGNRGFPSTGSYLYVPARKNSRTVRLCAADDMFGQQSALAIRPLRLSAAWQWFVRRNSVYDSFWPPLLTPNFDFKSLSKSGFVFRGQVIAGKATGCAGIDTVGCFNLYCSSVKAGPPTGFCLFDDQEEKDA